MNKVVAILTKRDGNTQAEAESRVRETKMMIASCDGNHEDAEEIMYEELGLEMDYLMDVLDFDGGEA